MSAHLTTCIYVILLSFYLVSAKQGNRFLEACADDGTCSRAHAVCTTTPSGDRCKLVGRRSCESDEDCEEPETCFKSGTAVAGYCDGCADDRDCADSDVCVKKTHFKNGTDNIYGKCNEKCSSDSECTADDEKCVISEGYCRREKHRNRCKGGRRKANRKNRREMRRKNRKNRLDAATGDAAQVGRRKGRRRGRKARRNRRQHR